MHGAKQKVAIQVQAKQKVRQTAGRRSSAHTIGERRLDSSTVESGGCGGGSERTVRARARVCADRETNQSQHPMLGIYRQKGQSTAGWKEAVRVIDVVCSFFLFFCSFFCFDLYTVHGFLDF